MNTYLPVSDASIGENEKRNVVDALDSGWISGSGPYVERFEQSFAEYLGVENALTCANGTAALHLALLALNIGPGDDVIVPALTYIATANAVRYCGATPVFADCNPKTWNAGIDEIAPLVTERTRAIIVVHLYGNPVAIDPIRELCRARGIALVEDAAEAHGAEYRGSKVGSFGDIATFSFYGNKLITTGEGGMVATNDPELAARVRLLRGQGMDPQRRYWFPVIGYNYRLTNIQCAIGMAQLERLAEFIDVRRRLAARYRTALADLPGIAFQRETPGAISVWWMFSILASSEAARDRLMQHLADADIETRPLFYPLHILPPYRTSAATCPGAERIGLTGLNLPTGGHVSVADVERIAELIRESSPS